MKSRLCKFGNFRGKFIFANSIKMKICDVNSSRLGHDLSISVNDRVISPIREGIILTKLRIFICFRKSKTLAKISEFTVLEGDGAYYILEQERLQLACTQAQNCWRCPFAYKK